MTMRTAITITIMADDGLDDGALYDLLSWMSPAWPTGAFAYSGGLEWAVEANRVVDRATTLDWIMAQMEHGALWSEAVIFVHAHRATKAADAKRLTEIAELAAAMLTSTERHLESTAQGAAFHRIAREAAPAATMGLLDGIAENALALPVAAGCTTAAHGLPECPALTAFLHAAAANLVSAAQRLVPLGQTDGQRVLREARTTIIATAARAAALDDGDPFDAMASAAIWADYATMAHETQYTRLFRT